MKHASQQAESSTWSNWSDFTSVWIVRGGACNEDYIGIIGVFRDENDAKRACDRENGVPGQWASYGDYEVK